MVVEAGAFSKNVDAAECMGCVAAISADLTRSHTLLPPPEGALRSLGSALDALPPQFAHLAESTALAQWLNIAALAEHEGAPRLAQLILDEVVRLVAKPCAASDGQQVNRSTREAMGICWARRGRLARLRGDLVDACNCYDEARSLVRHLPVRDAEPLGTIGLALVALGRGNFPEASRLMSALLRRNGTLAGMFKVQAHQILAFTHRRRGKLQAAMQHALAAFDLLDRSDFRRHELTVVMSEIAVELDDLDAARNGFRAVIGSDVKSRIRVPALIGAISVCVKQIGWPSASKVRHELDTYQVMLDRHVKESLAPGDLSAALLALAEAAFTLERYDAADNWLARAKDIAQEFGFHERQFAVNALEHRLMARRAGTQEAELVTDDGYNPQQRARRRLVRSPALQRLANVVLV